MKIIQHPISSPPFPPSIASNPVPSFPSSRGPEGSRAMGPDSEDLGSRTSGSRTIFLSLRAGLGRQRPATVGWGGQRAATVGNGRQRSFGNNSLKIIENHWNSLKINGNQFEINQNHWINENHWKSMKINENQWKSLKIFENLWKSMKINENQWKSMKINENQWKSSLA